MLLYLAAASLRLQSAAPKITFTQTTNVASLLQEVSRQTGAHLTAAPEEGREIVIVALQEVSLRPFMDDLSWATFGQWVKTARGFRFEKDHAAEARADDEYYGEAAKTLARSIALYRKGVLDPAATDDQVEAAALGKMNHPIPFFTHAPEARLMAKLLAIPDPVQAIPRNYRTWPDNTAWSNAPTPLEHDLGPAANDALQAYAAEKDLPWRIDQNGPTIVAVLTLGGEPEQASGNLQLYDAKGNLIPERIYAEFNERDPNWNRPPKNVLDEIPATATGAFSEATKAFTSRKNAPRMGMLVQRSAFVDLPRAIERLKNPEKFEPMATATADVWVAAAKATHRNLIACLDDSNMTPTLLGEPTFTIRPSFENLRNVRFLLKPDTQGGAPQVGWLLARPLVAHPPQGHQVDRAALGRYARADVRPQSLPALRASGEFLVHCGLPAVSWEIVQYIALACEAPAGTYIGGPEWTLPWFFGTLPPYLADAWTQGEPVDISQLPNESLLRLADWARPLNPWNSVPPGVPAIDAEPTHAFDGGLPRHGWLRSEQRVDEGFMVRTHWDVLVNESFMTAEGLAKLVLSKDPRLKLVEVQRDTRTVTRLWADLGPARPSPSEKFNDDTSTPSKYVAWDKAPPDIRAEIAGHTPP